MNTSISIGSAKVNIWVESGVVSGVQRMSETRVHGTVANGNGHISSTTSTWTDFALIGEDGIERPHFFTGHQVFLRNGNRISLISPLTGIGTGRIS